MDFNKRKWFLFSLRDGMSSNVQNWTDCTMLVQDLVVPSLNITADIPKEEAYNFQEMCQMFSKSQRSAPIKRNMYFSNDNLSANNKALPKSIVNRPKPTKDEKSKSVPNLSKKTVVKKSAVKSVAATLEDAIKNGKIFESIAAELTKVTTRCDERIPNETRILRILKSHFKTFDRTLNLLPVGSSTYGFGGSHSNYNIFIDTRKMAFS